MVERDQREGQKAPEDEGVGQAGKRPFANDLGLAENFPEKVPDAPADGEEVKAGVFAGFEDLVDDHAEAFPEERRGDSNQRDQEELFNQREMVRFGEQKLRHQQLALEGLGEAGRSKCCEQGHGLFVESSRLCLYLIGGCFGTRVV